MLSTSFLKRRWKLILNIVTLIALGGLLYAIRDQLVQTVQDFKNVNLWIVALIVPIELVNYHAQAKLYQHLFGVVGNKLPYRFLYRTSLELNFVNHVFPSGGVTGISYFGLRLRKGQEITGAKATLIQIMKLGLTFLSFELLIAVGLLCLAAVGRVSNMTMLVATALSTLVLMGTLGFAYIVGSQERINNFFGAATKLLNRLIQLVWRGHTETINISSAKNTVNDVHANYQLLRRSLRKLRAPFWYAFLANLTEVLALYIFFFAFGHTVNFGAVILAYAVANFAGLVSVLPGGVGIYEGLMTAVLATAGVPASISFPVIVMFRVVSTLTQIPIGYYFYHRTLSKGSGRGSEPQHAT